mmetsp:Transcript_13939/g.40840  ORF Transcript_13939/g.40840 Transcript_13939/m.40840 type:complete len:351 (-) Transcript_13939:233-1285(-)
MKRGVGAAALLLVHTATTTAGESTFLSIGDWGDRRAERVAKAMGDYSPEFILALGDNFYNSGVSSVDDRQFKTTFENQFSAESLQVPWYICAGNHDYYGGSAGIDAEIQYSSKSDRWVYPELYFSKEVQGSDGTSFLVVSTDTWRLNAGDTYVKFDLVSGRAVLRSRRLVEDHFARGLMDAGKRDALLRTFPEEDDPEHPLEVAADQDQLTWLNQTLCESAADWNLVMGHFPIFSATTGEHGDTPSLIDQVLPILEACGGHNTLYFSGHDHILQHNQLNNLHFLGSGAGARAHVGVNASYELLKGFHQGSYGFMAHAADKTTKQLRTDFVLADGSIPYSCVVDAAADDGA